MVMVIYTREAIAELIEQMDVPVVEFARRCKVHRTAVYHWLNGRCSPRMKEQVAINRVAREANLAVKVGSVSA